MVTRLELPIMMHGANAAGSNNTKMTSSEEIENTRNW